MKKSFVLDTNVLIHDPDSIEKFEDNDIYIPIYVIEELDKLKAEQTLRGRNARVACRKLDDLRYLGKISEGVQLDGGGKLCIYVPAERKRISVGLDNNSMDNAILQTAMEVKEKSALPTILVTMDVNLRVRADALDLQTAAYESQSIDPETIASGIVEVMSTGAEIDAMYANGKVDTRPEVKKDLYKNACIELKDEITGRTALGRYRMDERIHPVRLPKEGILGIKPRNREQQFALDLLLDDDLSLVSLTGVAGSGKSLLTLAAGLSKILEGKYTRLLVSRPVVPMGKDLGYLPGDLSEKLAPWMQPIYDNLELLMMSAGKKKTSMTMDDMISQGMIKVEPLTYIRGRSIPGQFFILDESQNLNTHEIKTIITRCGEGTKIVLTGDPQQIDSPYLDQSSCGLSVAVDKLHDNDIVGHLTLTKGERSELANLAAKNL